jgi:hypothetical protein
MLAAGRDRAREGAMIVFGNRLFGKVEEVPGMFHVATKFFHVNFVPLLPFESWIVVSGSQEHGLLGSRWQGFRLSSLRWGSALMAWLRFGLVLGAVGLLVGGGAAASGGGFTGWLLLLLAGMCGGAFWYSYQLSRATPESLARLVQDDAFPVDLARAARERLRSQAVRG